MAAPTDLVHSPRMQFSGFTAQQRQVVIDLVVLAMYLDRNLASVEDSRIKRLLEAMCFSTEHDRNREFDAAVTRVRPHSESQDVARAHAVRLAEQLATPEQRRIVLQAIEDLISADGSIAPAETAFLEMIRGVLK